MYSNKDSKFKLTITNNVNNENISKLVDILKNKEKQNNNKSSIENYLYFRTTLDNVIKICKKIEIKNNGEYNLNLYI